MYMRVLQPLATHSLLQKYLKNSPAITGYMPLQSKRIVFDMLGFDVILGLD